MSSPSQPSPSFKRRGLLAAGLGGIGAAGLAAVPPAAAAATARLPLTAQTTEGPYYFDPQRVRADITEGLRGVALEVRFTVLGAGGRPWQGARVDIWHCNAAGIYSGYGGQGDDHRVSTRGETFLRGSLPTDRDGVAAFTTLYPGWYEGRTTHIHVKVLNGSRAVLTTQFFLPDALSEFLYTQQPDYQRTRVRDTLNSTDGIALQAGNTVLGAVREEADRYVASLVLVVDPAAHPQIDRPPVPGEWPPPGPPGTAGGPPERPAILQGTERLAALLPGQARTRAAQR
jgi:protocatechuate 3,4-dioxygenase beta subunit